MPAGSNNQLDFRPPSPAGDNGQDHHHEVERKSLFNRLFERGAIDDDAMRAPGDNGSIKKIVMPKDWQPVMQDLSQKDNLIGAPMMKEYSPPGDASVKLSYWNRSFGNVKEDAGTARAFAHILSHEPHHLNARELDSIKHLIGDGLYGNGDPMAIINAETRKVHGRNVLTVESAYKSLDPEKPDRRSFSMFINSDGSGRYTEQLSYQAPNDTYARHLGSAVETFNSVKWRKGGKSPF